MNVHAGRGLIWEGRRLAQVFLYFWGLRNLAVLLGASTPALRSCSRLVALAGPQSIPSPSQAALAGAVSPGCGEQGWGCRVGLGAWSPADPEPC